METSRSRASRSGQHRERRTGPGGFQRVLTAWDQPEHGWTGYTLDVADITGDGKADLVWNSLGITTNRTYTAISTF